MNDVAECEVTATKKTKFNHCPCVVSLFWLFLNDFFFYDDNITVWFLKWTSILYKSWNSPPTKSYFSSPHLLRGHLMWFESTEELLHEGISWNYYILSAWWTPKTHYGRCAALANISSGERQRRRGRRRKPLIAFPIQVDKVIKNNTADAWIALTVRSFYCAIADATTHLGRSDDHHVVVLFAQSVAYYFPYTAASYRNVRSNTKVIVSWASPPSSRWWTREQWYNAQGIDFLGFVKDDCHVPIIVYSDQRPRCNALSQSLFVWMAIDSLLLLVPYVTKKSRCWNMCLLLMTNRFHNWFYICISLFFFFCRRWAKHARLIWALPRPLRAETTCLAVASTTLPQHRLLPIPSLHAELDCK